MKKNKSVFILFVVLFAITAVANIARVIVYIVQNISLITSAPNYAPVDVTRLFFNNLLSGGLGVALFILTLVFFVCAVVFGIKYFRNSESFNNVKSEAKTFSENINKTTDSVETTIKQEGKAFVEDMKNFFSGVKEKISTPASITCEYCGAKNNKGVKFCSQCGASINNNQENK